MMLKQSPTRNLRAPGGQYKIKLVSQICLMFAVSLWTMYQLRHCYFNKAAINERTLGRKGLLPGLVEDDYDEDSKGFDEAARGDEFELMEEADEQEAEEIDDKEQENKSDDVFAKKFTMRNRTDIMGD